MRIDLNEAGLRELAALPGVGDALARRIAEQRAKRGCFTGVEELLDVKGIGPVRLAGMAGHLRVGPCGGLSGSAE